MLVKGTHYNTEIEEAILGICLLEKTAFARIYNVLKAEVFYSDPHKVVFEILKEMFDKSIAIDLLTVWDYMQRVKGIAEINQQNTAYFLSRLTNSVVSSANMERHSLILQEMWCERELINLTHAGTNSDISRQTRVKEIQDKLFNLQTTSVSDGWKQMDEMIVGLYKHQDKMTETKGMGLLTGFKTIDRVYGGFHNGQMIVIGARPSMGKSALAGQIAMNIAAKNKKVGIISLEMSNNEIMARMASIDTDIDFNTIYRALFIDEYQRDQFYQKLNNSTVNLPIWVSEKTDVNISAIKAQAMKLKYKSGIDCLIIDYLQLIGGETSKNKNRENVVAEISRGFKILCKELDIPGIILCQLNREVEKRKGMDRFPKLSDLRESGAIEQDADCVLFLHRDFMSGIPTNENGQSTENEAHLVIRKWRNGEANLILDLEFNGPKMKFKEKQFFIHVPKEEEEKLF